MHAIHKITQAQSCNLKIYEAKMWVKYQDLLQVLFNEKILKEFSVQDIYKERPLEGVRRRRREQTSQIRFRSDAWQLQSIPWASVELKWHLRVVHVELHFILPPWPAIGYEPPSRSWLWAEWLSTTEGIPESVAWASGSNKL